MIRFNLNRENDEVYGKFVLTVCVCSILYFCKKNCGLQKKQTLLLFHKRYIIKNIILHLRKLKMERAKCFHEYL